MTLGPDVGTPAVVIQLLSNQDGLKILSLRDEDVVVATQISQYIVPDDPVSVIIGESAKDKKGYRVAEYSFTSFGI